MKKFKEILNDTLAILAQAGATNVRVIYGGKHPKVTFLYREQNLVVALSGTPGEYRTRLNTRTTVKKTLRLADERATARGQ